MAEHLCNPSIARSNQFQDCHSVYEYDVRKIFLLYVGIRCSTNLVMTMCCSLCLKFTSSYITWVLDDKLSRAREPSVKKSRHHVEQRDCTLDSL